MINKLKLFLKKNISFKKALMATPFKKTFFNRKEAVKKIWNKESINKKKVRIKKVKKKQSTIQISINKIKASFSKFKLISNFKKNIKNHNLKKSLNSTFLSLNNKLIAKFNLNKSINFKLSNRLKSFRKKAKINKSISSIDLKFISNYFPEIYSNKIQNLLKNLGSNNLNKSSSRKQAFSINFLGISYVDNVLSVIYIARLNNKNVIKDIVNINIPGDLIGDYKVEKIPEVNRIIDDVINIFGLKNPPIILFLSSSFFTARTFNDNELVVFSEEDPVILSKSPFLPDKTLVQYKRVNGDKKSSYHRVIYADKEVIDSWMNVITLTGSKIATLTCGSLHLAEKLADNSDEEITVLCDIGNNSTTTYLIRKECELISTRLPFGSSIYTTGEESLNSEFFSRLDSSIKKILKNNNLKFEGKVFINGNGIDNMLSKNSHINEGFIQIPNNNYKVDSDKDFNIVLNQTLLNSFSNLIDMIAK